MTETATNKDYADVAEVIRSAMHDLRGPIINIQGFLFELRDAAAHMQSLVGRDAGAIPDATHNELTETLEGDVAECLKFLDRAVGQMNSRLDECGASLEMRKISPQCRQD